MTVVAAARGLLDDVGMAPDARHLLDLAARLKREHRDGDEVLRLRGRAIALLFEKPSTRTRTAFELAGVQQGAHVTAIDARQTHLGETESVEDTATVLGRIYDGIAYRGFAQSRLVELAAASSAPVWNALSDDWHPTQALADFLTLEECVGRPASEITVAFVGDGRDNVVHSLLVTGAALGARVRVGCPAQLAPREDVVETARRLAVGSGGTVAITTDPRMAVAGADAVMTDVWVSMGESDELWEERAQALRSYRVDADLMAATGSPRARFLHPLPAVHDASTTVGQRLHRLTGLVGAEVADDVFRSPRSVVFQQAENRLHTIKALLVAQLA